MALMTCPECSTQMSDTAPACPRCGWARAALHAAAVRSASASEGQKLVKKSTMLALAGFATMVGGLVGGMMATNSTVTGAGMSLGLVLLVIAGVVGQIGRAKQGRVI